MESEQAAAQGVSARLAALAGAMRAQRVRVGLGELLVAHSALAAVDAADRRQAHHALRAALCSSRADYEAFDIAFEDTFGALDERVPVRANTLTTEPVETPTGGAHEAPPEGEERRAATPAGWSDLERLRRTDFAELDEAELGIVAALIADIARRGPQRRSRRLRTSPHLGRGRHASVDVRATIRDSLRYGGEPLRRRWRRPTMRPRRLVVLCDVSGSMGPYSRGLLLYVQALVAARRSVEAFVFGTRLTRVTAELAGRDPVRALDRLGTVVSDWAGGTRIGESLRTLNREHGGRIGRGAVVIMLSDGWDRGETGELKAELARLRRTAHRLVWLNPLKARPGYEPLATGMAAALPHLDAFLAGNSVAGLEELAALLAAGLEVTPGTPG